jgi:hypothetical protein
MNSRFSKNGHFWLKTAIFKTFSGRQAMKGIYEKRPFYPSKTRLILFNLTTYKKA